MLITAVITLATVIAWAVTARALFRRWVRNDLARRHCRDCSPEPLSRSAVAALAISGALALPVLAFVAFITHNPPVSRSELETRTRALEAENTRLQREQDRQDPPRPVSHGHDDYEEDEHELTSPIPRAGRPSSCTRTSPVLPDDYR